MNMSTGTTGAFAAPCGARWACGGAVGGAPRVCAARPVRRRAVRVVRAGLLGEKYGHLRGKKVEPVSAAVARFAQAYPKPVPIVYRSLVAEIVGSTHLATVCALWRYCKVFAFGLDEVFAETLRFYPGEDGERDELYRAVCAALVLDYDAVRGDAAEVREWCVGKTEEDVFAAAEAGEGPVGEAFARARNGTPVLEWYYSRLFGLGMIRVMAGVGVELGVAPAEAWAEAMDMPVSSLSTEMSSYLSTAERMKQAEQMFAEVAARDARKTAERLAEKAEKAKARAAKLEGGDDDDAVAADAPVAAAVKAEDK